MWQANPRCILFPPSRSPPSGKARWGSARLLAGTAGPNMIELWRWEMQPGEAFASPGHPATTFELLHVEAGALTLTLGETCRTVAAGESAVARTEIEHGYRNEGTAPLVFTMTVAELPS